MGNEGEFLARRLGEYAAGVKLEQLPPRVIEQAAFLVLHNAGNAIGGGQSPWGPVILKGLEQMGVASPTGSGLASLPRQAVVQGGGGRIASMPWAAFAGASLANALDYDDVRFGHPGAVVVPTALAVGQGVGAPGAELLAAVVAGYEICCRLSRASGPSGAQRMLVWGQGSRFAPAAGAVAARLLGLNPEQTAHAIAIAAANGPLPSVNKTVYGDGGPSMVKNNFGMAALAGVNAAFMAQQGFEGPLDLFEGETGWWRMLNSDRWDPADAGGRLGEEYEILKVGFKAYPCCRFIHAALDGVLNLARENRLQPEAIEEIVIKTYTWAARPPFTDPAPPTMADAQYSTAYTTAVALLGYPAGPRWFAPEVLADPKVHALGRKMRFIPWPQADDHHMEEWLAEVTVRTATAEEQRLVRFPLGHHQNPMSREQVLAKYHTLATSSLSDGDARTLSDGLLTLASLPDLRTVAPLLGG